MAVSYVSAGALTDLREHRIETGTQHRCPVDCSHIAAAILIPECDLLIAIDAIEVLFSL